MSTEAAHLIHQSMPWGGVTFFKVCCAIIILSNLGRGFIPLPVQLRAVAIAAVLDEWIIYLNKSRLLFFWYDTFKIN